MKLRLVLAFLILSIACGVPVGTLPTNTPTPATQTNQDEKTTQEPEWRFYAVLGETVNLRAGPGAGYEVIRIVEKGDILLASCRPDRYKNWCAISSGAWIYAPCITGDGICK